MERHIKVSNCIANLAIVVLEEAGAKVTINPNYFDAQCKELIVFGMFSEAIRDVLAASGIDAEIL